MNNLEQKTNYSSSKEEGCLSIILKTLFNLLIVALAIYITLARCSSFDPLIWGKP